MSKVPIRPSHIAAAQLQVAAMAKLGKEPAQWVKDLAGARPDRPVCGERRPVPRVGRLRRFARAVVDGLADWIDRDPARRADEGKP